MFTPYIKFLGQWQVLRTPLALKTVESASLSQFKKKKHQPKHFYSILFYSIP